MPFMPFMACSWPREKSRIPSCRGHARYRLSQPHCNVVVVWPTMHYPEGLDTWSLSWRRALLLRSGDVEPNPGPTDYQLHPRIFAEVVTAFTSKGCPRPYIDAFAESHNTLLPRFWAPTDNALSKDWWASLPIWANPPFDLFVDIHAKLLAEGGHVLLLVPGWKAILPLFWPHAMVVYQLPTGPLFLYRGRTRNRRRGGAHLSSGYA